MVPSADRLLTAALALAMLGAASPPSSGPVVVELFTSQGCSSCPPANDTLAKLADRDDVLALSFGVTYWDQLGWKDTFASPQFTDRQRDYDRSLPGTVATPQMVIDGRKDTPGQSLSKVEPLIAAAKARARAAPPISWAGRSVQIGAGAATSAQVWLVRYDPRVMQVPVRAGENGGRTLPHRDVVRQLVRLGDWRGAARSFDLPKSPSMGLKTAVLVQAGRGGPIVAASRSAA